MRRKNVVVALLGMIVVVAVLYVTFQGGAPKKEAKKSSEPAKKVAPAEKKEEKVAKASPAKSASLFGTSKVSGVATFTGKVPKEKKDPSRSFAECKVDNVGDRHAAFRVQDGKLQNVFVHIKEGIAAKHPTPSSEVILDQVGCAYIPRVFGIQVGQTLRVLNSDPALHNVRTKPTFRKDAFNLGMPTKGVELTRTFSQPEVMIPFKCDVHGWMRAYVGVLTHPFYAVSDAGGAFEIKSLPAGKYTVEAWHEKLGALQQTIELSEGQSAELSFDFSESK